MADKYVIQRRTASGLENVAELPALENGKVDLSWLPVVGESGAAIIARGSNANGEWVRWADGTQICRSTIELTGIDVPETQTVWESSAYTPPAAFVGNYDIIPVMASGKYSEYYVFLAVGYINTFFRIWNTGKSNQEVHVGVAIRGGSIIGTSHNVISATIRVVAIGKWK